MSYNLSSTSPIYHYIHSSPSNPSKCTPNLSIILNRIRLHNSPRPGLSTIHLRLTLRQLAPALAISNFPSILFHRKPQSYKHKLFLPISPGPRPYIHRILSHTGLLPIHPLSPPPVPFSSHGALQRQFHLSPHATRRLPHPIHLSSQWANMPVMRSLPTGLGERTIVGRGHRRDPWRAALYPRSLANRAMRPGRGPLPPTKLGTELPDETGPARLDLQPSHQYTNWRARRCLG